MPLLRVSFPHLFRPAALVSYLIASAYACVRAKSFFPRVRPVKSRFVLGHRVWVPPRYQDIHIEIRALLVPAWIIRNEGKAISSHRIVSSRTGRLNSSLCITISERRCCAVPLCGPSSKEENGKLHLALLSWLECFESEFYLLIKILHHK